MFQKSSENTWINGSHRVVGVKIERGVTHIASVVTQPGDEANCSSVDVDKRIFSRLLI